MAPRGFRTSWATPAASCPMPGQLLDPHDVALRVQQVFGHRAVARTQPVQLGGLVDRHRARQGADGEAIRLRRQDLQRPHHRAVHQVCAEQHEHGRAAEPERDQRPERLPDVAAVQEHRREPDQDHGGGCDKTEADEQLGAKRPPLHDSGLPRAGPAHGVHVGLPSSRRRRHRTAGAHEDRTGAGGARVGGRGAPARRRTHSPA